MLRRNRWTSNRWVVHYWLYSHLILNQEQLSRSLILVVLDHSTLHLHA